MIADVEVFTNRKILLSEVMAVDCIFKNNNISFTMEKMLHAKVIVEYLDTPQKFSFNRDFALVFIELEKSRLMELASAYSSTNPIAVLGPSIFVSYSPVVLELLKLEFMFGGSLPINNYRCYIQPFNQKLAQIAGNRELPVFPTRKPTSRKQIGYFRYWVFKERMTALYYPNDSLPRYDCDIEEYYRSDDCGINLLLDQDKIVAVDGWMKVP
ncbi:MAG: hypothetical protein LBH59_10360, partial [Planctomycetaceae bacterium]|nr:hypothetical protein [Planctomycetaceae bacterium]